MERQGGEDLKTASRALRSGSFSSLGPGGHLGQGSSPGRPTRRRALSRISGLQPLDGSGASSLPGRDIQKWLPGGKNLPVETHGSRERLQVRTKYWGLLINVPEDSPHIKKKILTGIYTASLCSAV